MGKTNRMDEVLKELGALYEFNREIQKFSFVVPGERDAEEPNFNSPEQDWAEPQMRK